MKVAESDRRYIAEAESTTDSAAMCHLTTLMFSYEKANRDTRDVARLKIRVAWKKILT